MVGLFQHIRLLLACFVMFFINESFCFAVSAEEIALRLENEPQATKPLLKEAYKLASHTQNIDDLWQAAVRYCDAARLGSTEAQYQLGMLYAFGAGVPKQRQYAAALFSMAGQQGHYEAQNMLETIQLDSTTLPDCITTASKKPEKPERELDFSTYNAGARTTYGVDIATKISHLPKNKIWIVDLVRTMSTWYQIDPHFALSIISVESNFNPDARSQKNAMGLMQIIPATAERFNVDDAFNASQNVKAGLKYLKWLLNRYKGNVALAAAGYNAGEGNVDRYHGVPPYPETQKYVDHVLGLYKKDKCC